MKVRSNQRMDLLISYLIVAQFMQRAAAASSHSNDQKPDGAPSKRRKLSDHQPPPITPSADAQFLQAAADAEDVKRAAAMERLATEAGETRWVLSTADAAHTIGTDMKLRILTTGYSDIDQDVQSMGWQGSLGRRSFGLFNRAIEVLLPSIHGAVSVRLCSRLLKSRSI